MDSRFLQVSNTHPQFVNQNGEWIRLRGVNFAINNQSPLATHLDRIKGWGSFA
jgi:hypothetical protein